ncbi:dde family endonuclease [Gigaspora margarita]|uniref:Dde family endonuclease n=1 Tax=Gigaspora margarita TaxID=4874 RepID=A0A8H4AJE6_GIGMA|nr:dde family endonuclease [Gigaspora margarita]
MVDEFDKLYNSDRQSESDVSDLEWGDEEDSGWDDTENTETEIKIYQKLKELKLVWKNDNQLEKVKRGLYMKGNVPKSTYYDKYRPNGVFTKAAIGTKKITSFFTNSQLLEPCELENTPSDSESESESYVYKINKKANDLKLQLEQNHNKLTVKEYNDKRAILNILVC